MHRQRLLQRFPRWRLARRHRQGGFTLVEVLVTVAIAAILLGLGVPSMRAALARHAVAAQADEFIEALHLARSEAMKRGGPVVLCKTDPAATSFCSIDPRIGWQTWMVFADANRSGTYEAGEVVLRAHAKVDDRVGMTGDARLDVVRFEPTGVALPNTAAPAVLFVLGVPDDAGSNASHARQRVCLGTRGDVALLDATGTCP